MRRLAACLLLASCASPSQVFIAPLGDAHRCATLGTGLIGATVATQSFDKCTAEMRALGYLPLEQAGLIGIQFAETEPTRALVSFVAPNSPAAKSGIVLGDEVTAVDGQTVIDRASALRLMFGHVGVPVRLTVKHQDISSDLNLVRAPRIQ